MNAVSRRRRLIDRFLQRPLRSIVVLLLALIFVPPIATSGFRLVASSLGAGERSFQAVTLEESVFTEVEFRNEAQDLDLAGMVFRPVGEGPFPATVIINGSGTSHRESTWYLTVADHLQNSGILVLLPDKRGSEMSEGDWRTSSFEDLATDTEAAVLYLMEQSQFPVSSVGVLGMSQGGRIAPIAASRTIEIAWVVNMVGGGIPAFQGLQYEEIHNLQEMGVLPGVSNVFARASSWTIINLAQQEFWSAVGNFDPITYWTAVEQPSLVLFGEEDTNVDTHAGTARIDALGQTNITVNVYPGSGHGLEDPPGQGDRLIRQEALDDIVNFVTSATQP